MKTKEEWAIEQFGVFLHDDGTLGGHVEVHATSFGLIVAAIQLDAWKQGMTDAALLATSVRQFYNELNTVEGSSHNSAITHFLQAITKARDNNPPKI
jgi:hypothetical protein